ncbi:hypothetical protein SELMODRAFT_91577 [Selaginella moellendorffii]|uniref:Cytochrome P450-dependent monooxygenase n=1 Tax=Selaginella moellendorffii TaxID=88036 RepID=D8REI5_SELML|nr:flavonoid 3'-monooxygenase [Selaginella moellendorffii]EFJ29451.1 hypothetical protein SELMODRAFT_91577 [Selaginella moellendorffii]|eukprot:XP_002969363.1 flavonoid 3'-monooxygenase [Selaginella moellendorffii]
MGITIAILVCLLATAAIIKSLLAGRSSRLPPGPISFPVVGSLLSLRQPLHRHFARLADRYGPIVFLKIGMVPYVIANTARAAEFFLKIHDAEFANRPQSEEFFRIFSFGWSDLAFRSPGPEWKLMRKICATNLFSNAMLATSAPYRRSQLQSAMDAILDRSRGGEPVNLRTLFARYTSGSLCLTLFSEECPEVVETINNMAGQAINLNIGEIIPSLDWMDLHGVYAKMRGEIMPRIKALLDDQVREHQERKKAAGDGFVCRDFVDVLISLDESDKLSDQEIIGLLCDMVGAGFKTSMESIEWCMAEVISKPEIMRKAQEELDQIIGRERAVEEHDLQNLPFIQAILKEALRLHPAVPLGMPHYNLRPVELGDGHGTIIPAKCKLLVNLWAANRDPAHWTSPHEFQPERFLGTNISPGGQHFQIIPFSAGRRMCAGYGLAMRSLFFLLASLLHGFIWSEISDNPIVLEESIGTISCPPAKDLIVAASPRIEERILAQY